VAAFLVSGLFVSALVAATGGAGSVEIVVMTMLAFIIGVSVAVVHRRRAASRVTDGS
jgi:hypothetical protein